MVSIFIGSSSESLPLLRQIEGVLLRGGHRIRAWDDHGVFPVGDFVLERLHEEARSVDAAVFVLAAHDQREGTRRGAAARDNVLCELGMFLGELGRHRAVLCWDGVAQLPSDLAGVTVLKIGACEHDDARGLQTWADGLTPRARTHVVPEGREVAEVFQCFPLKLFRRQLVGAGDIAILQTFIPFPLHMNLFREEFTDALAAGAKVRILLCDPWSAACKIRQRSLGRVGIHVRHEIESNLYHFEDLHRGLPDEAQPRLSVRVCSNLPSVSIYRVDDMMLCGHYWHETLAIDGPQLRVAAGDSDLRKRLEMEYRRIWERRDTRPVPLGEVEPWLRDGPTSR